jgi:Plasmid pRiA4b ORF-3-like protein
MSPARNNAASDSINEIATVRIELRHSDPLIWRQVEVPTSVTLKILHDIIQIVMGWFDDHLWEFTIGKQKYGLPMDEDWGTKPRIEASKMRLRDVLKARKTVIDYTYDFGDCWEHRLTVTDVRAGQPEVSYPRYIGGEWNAPPEDCGGIPGFYAMRCSKLAAIPPIRTMPKPRNGPMTTIRKSSISCQSNTPLAVSQTAATPPGHAPPIKSKAGPKPDPPQSTRRGLHRRDT